MINIEINNDQSHVPVDEPRLCDAVRMVLDDAGVSRGEISVAVVDDPAICRLHKKYLDQDEPTDVLSFVYERGEDSLEGEVIVSAETAQMTAGWYGWTAADELLLYVIHGALHLVGYDDVAPEDRARMRDGEALYLGRFGLELHAEESPSSQDSTSPGA